ncbi:MAG TPA: zinc-ribbon domain-containing protein [Pyrinomonadaceae bacterium]
MFCPQCGTESPADLKFCRMCGANLRVIGKAVTLSEAIARSDSVPSKIKDLVTNLKIEKVSEEVARAMEKVKQEITHTAEDHREWHRERAGRKRKEKTAEQRREKHLTTGLVTMFSGVGLSIFLYFLSGAIVLKLPPDVAADIPFELEPVIRVAWMVGLIPALTGFGRVIAGLTIRRDRQAEIASPAATPLRLGEPPENPLDQPPAFVTRHDDEATEFAPLSAPGSITDRTTNILERQAQVRQTDEMR